MQRMPDDLYRRLAEASGGFSEPIFVRDPESGRYECALFDESAEDDDVLIDAACMACELLSDAGDTFTGDPLLGDEQSGPGEVRVEYRFDAEEEAIYQAFRRMLELRSPNGIRAEFRRQAWGHMASVTISYVSDFDYQRKKDSVDWLLHLARKRATNSPISGKKLW